MSHFWCSKLPVILIAASVLITGCSGKSTIPETKTEAQTEPETAAVSALPTTTDTDTKDTEIYVSLGDSIARGYGLTSPTEERYSTIVAGLLERSGVSVDIFNYGVDGQTSAELFYTLTDGTVPADVLSDMELCTISIGANNILGPGIQFLYAYYQYLYSDPAPYDDAGIAERYQVFTDECAAGIEQLQSDIPQIIDTLKTASPEVEILFLTLYNPYAHSPIVLNINGMPIRLATLSDTYCTLVNQCIIDGSDNGANYRVVDVYTAFSGTDGAYVNVTNPEGLSETDMDMSAMDPHPNKAGHAQIAKCIVDVLENTQ